MNMQPKLYCGAFGPVRYDADIMLSLLTSHLFNRKLEDLPAVLVASATQALADALPDLDELEETPMLRTVGWLTAGVGALALGLFVGRELRQRYKFNRRTPYDFYAHSGDEMQDIEFGVGI